MADVVIQMGHVPLTSGATGTHREQEFNKALAPLIQSALIARGHSVRVVGSAMPPVTCDVFIALHCDGSLNHNVRGGSVGYPSDDPNSPSGKLANAWKRYHQHYGYVGGFHRDNYTRDLRGYYGFRLATSKWEFLAEHGTTTNPEDETWLFANLDKCALAHVDAIGEVVGHPIVQVTPEVVTRMFDLTLPPGVSMIGNLKHPNGGEAILLSDGGVLAFDCPMDGNVFNKSYMKPDHRPEKILPNPSYSPGNGRPWYIIQDQHGHSYGHDSF